MTDIIKIKGLCNDLNVISAEIKTYQNIGARSMLEIGKRLVHVRQSKLAEQSKYGNWEKWIKSLGIGPDAARKSMKAYTQFGNNSRAIDLNPSKLLELIWLPEEVDKDKFLVEEHVMPSTGEKKKVEDMTRDELREVLKILKIEQDEQVKLLREEQVERERIEKEVRIELEKEIENLQNEMKALESSKPEMTDEEKEKLLAAQGEEAEKLKAEMKQKEEDWKKKFSETEAKITELMESYKPYENPIKKDIEYIQLLLSSCQLKFDAWNLNLMEVFEKMPVNEYEYTLGIVESMGFRLKSLVEKHGEIFGSAMKKQTIRIVK